MTALLKAGRTRFRPILMTSLCTILGLVPLAMGFGPGAQMQQPLAIAVIGGLITNMLLTRLLIPVGYLVLKGARRQWSSDGRSRQGKRMGRFSDWPQERERRVYWNPRRIGMPQ